jgi:TRAP-type C4-dicarboxylate transport system substrate-binding protein
MAVSFLRTVYPRTFLVALVWACLALSPQPASSQNGPIVIKLASLAPANSRWDGALREMGERWKVASHGQVILRIYPNGLGGEENDVLRRMKIGQFQAGGFTIAGLQNLTPAVAVLAIPMLMENQDELHRVRAAVGPKLEEVFLEKGYVLLHWMDMGWMRFFVPGPDPSIQAIQSYRYMEWGESSLLRLWRDTGFSPGVRLNLPDVTVGLKTGLVDGINTAPLVIAGYQWFTELPYMIDIPWGPLSGATLVDRETWERIPEEIRPELIRIARETGEEVEASLIQWEADAIEAMKAHGLQVIDPPPEVRDQWERLFESSWDMLRGDIIPEAWFDEALRAAREGRGG